MARYRDPYIPNQICILLQSLEYALDVLEHGGTPEQVRACIEAGNEAMDFVREHYEPEWTRIHNLLGDQSYPPDGVEGAGGLDDESPDHGH